MRLHGGTLAAIATCAALGLVAGCGRDAGGGGRTAAGDDAIELLRGDRGGDGNIDGRGDDARFSFPTWLQATADGALLVYQQGSGVRRVTRDGDVTTLVSSRDVAIEGFAALPDGSVALVSQHEGIVRRRAQDGTIARLAGGGTPGLVDGRGDAARFKWIWGGAVDGDGRLHVFDDDGRVLRRVDLDGDVTTVPTPAIRDGLVRRFVALAPTDDGGWWAVSDHDPVVLRLAPDGRVLRKIGTGQPGFADGADATAQFSEPAGIAARGDLVVVADAGNGAIRRIHPDGRVTTIHRTSCPPLSDCVDADGRPAVPSVPQGPHGIALLDGATIAVADRRSDAIYLVGLDGRVTRLAGRPAAPRDVKTQGPPTAGCTMLAAGVDGSLHCQDASGNLWRLEDGVPTRPVFVYAAMRDALAARVANAAGAAADPLGELPPLDWDAEAPGALEPATPPPGASAGAPPSDVSLLPGQNGFVGTDAVLSTDPDAHVVLRFPTDDPLPRVLAGREFEPGARDGAAAASRFREPRAVVLDARGDAYVADAGNHAIRRIAPDGVVSTYAGRLGAAGLVDGPAGDARFLEPHALALARDGTLYVADRSGGMIRRIDAQRRVTTMGGARLDGCARDGACVPCASCGIACGFGTWTRLAVDPKGRLYATTDGVVWHVPADAPPRAVVGTPGRYGLGRGPLPSTLPRAFGIGFEPDGDLLLADDARVLRVRAATLEARLAALDAEAREPSARPAAPSGGACAAVGARSSGHRHQAALEPLSRGES